MIEHRRLIGHQTRAGDSAEMERGLVNRERAEIDQPRRDQRTFGINHDVAGLGGHITQRGNPAIGAAQSAHVRRAVGQDHKAIDDC